MVFISKNIVYLIFVGDNIYEGEKTITTDRG